MTALRSEYPLTRFLGTLLGYSDQHLAKADPDKAAQHFGISSDHAAAYIKQQREIRGVVSKGGAQ